MTDYAGTQRTGSSTLGLAVIYVTTLFFIWAVITNLLDPALAAMKTIFKLNTIEANLTTSAFFIAYGVMSLPSAGFLSRAGYATSVLVGLAGIVAGCALAYVSTVIENYSVFLVALFTMASGITLLQVAANPLIAAMGAPKDSAFRLNLSQAFNSLGAACGIFFGSSFLLQGEIFEKDVVITDALRQQALIDIGAVYVKLGLFLAVFICLMFLVRNVIAKNAPKTSGGVSPWAALSSKWANLGAVAIFFYVGAEVAIGSNLINYLEQAQILNIEKQAAGHLVTWYMIFAMLGRFGGSALMKFIKGYTILVAAALGAMILCAYVAFNYAAVQGAPTGSFVMPIVNVDVPISPGTLLGFAAICVGIFNSIMFPTIFTTTLERSSAAASATSGLLCVAIVGGAVIPPIFAAVRDATNSYSLAFIVPLICYGYILWFASAARSAPIHAIEENVAGGH